MAIRYKSPEEILSEAVLLRAQTYRRWRRLADEETATAKRRVYEALAALECDRFDELVHRYAASSTAPAAAAFGGTPALRERAATALASARGTPLRAAAVAAEAERRTWAALLRRTGAQDPKHPLLTLLVEDARRVRDLVGTSLAKR